MKTLLTIILTIFFSINVLAQDLNDAIALYDDPLGGISTATVPRDLERIAVLANQYKSPAIRLGIVIHDRSVFGEQDFNNKITFAINSIKQAESLYNQNGVQLIIAFQIPRSFGGGDANGHDKFIYNEADWQSLRNVNIRLFTELGNLSHIKGFQFCNEPNFFKKDTEVYNGMIAQTIADIKKYARNKLLYINSRHGSPDTLRELKPFKYKNLIYSFHQYYPFDITHQFNNPGVGLGYPDSKGKVFKNNSDTRERIKRSFQSALNFRAEHNIKLYVGEYGVSYYSGYPNNENRKTWVKATARVFRENNIRSSYFTIFANHPMTPSIPYGPCGGSGVADWCTVDKFNCTEFKELLKNLGIKAKDIE